MSLNESELKLIKEILKNKMVMNEDEPANLNLMGETIQIEIIIEKINNELKNIIKREG